jgi:tetratricopeptide (TPR) repeat protein
LPEFSREERLEFVEYAQRMGRVDLVAKHLTVLLEGPEPPSRIWRLAVGHLRARGEVVQAVGAARRWLAQDPANEDAQFGLGEAALLHPDSAVRKEGRGLLWTLAAGRGPMARSAIGALVQQPDLNRGELEALHRSAEAMDATPVLLTGLRLRLEPDRRGELLAGLVRACNTTNLAVRREGVAFLADQKELGLSLELMPAEVARTDARLRGARLQALLDVGRIEEAKLELAELKPTDGVELHLRRCLEARVEVAAQKLDNAATLLRQAVDAAGNKAEPLRFCGIYAERLGFDRVALVAYQRLSELPGATVPAGRNVLRLALKLDETREAQVAMRRVSRFLPGDEAFLVGSVYLDLLVGERTALDRLPELEKVLVKRPKDAFTVATVALARWRAGRLPAALELLDQAGVEWEKSEARCQAVRAAILGANLQREAARRMVRELDWERLLSAERQLVQEWR